MIRNWGNSFDVGEDLSLSVGEGFRLESRFSERELDRLDLDDLLDLVSEERILADDFLSPSSFGERFDLVNKHVIARPDEKNTHE